MLGTLPKASALALKCKQALRREHENSLFPDLQAKKALLDRASIGTYNPITTKGTKSKCAVPFVLQSLNAQVCTAPTFCLFLTFTTAGGENRL